jgi:hypothetical protein
MEIIQTKVVLKSVILIVEMLVQEHQLVMAEDVEMLTTCAIVIVVVTHASQPN